MDESCYKNILKCMDIKQSCNKTIIRKPFNLHLYFVENDNIDVYNELKRIEDFNFDNIFLYLKDEQYFYGELLDYIESKNIVIINKLNKNSDVTYENIFVDYVITDLLEHITNNVDNYRKIKTIFYTKKCEDDILVLKSLLPYTKFIKVTYLLGEHIGIHDNNMYVKSFSDENFYFTDANELIDYFIKYKLLTYEKCVECNDSILCVSNMLESCIYD